MDTVVDGFAGRGVELALVREHDTVLGRAIQAGDAQGRTFVHTEVFTGVARIGEELRPLDGRRGGFAVDTSP